MISTALWLESESEYNRQFFVYSCSWYQISQVFENEQVGEIAKKNLKLRGTRQKLIS